MNARPYALCLTGLFALALVACQSDRPEAERDQAQVVRLGEGDPAAFSRIREVFQARNPGYDLEYFHQVRALPATPSERLAFVQGGGGTATLSSADSSKVSVGDIICLRQEESIGLDSLLDLLVFTVPEALPAELPAFIRPDWDPNITDTPGGCATETGAYRRILLTWLGKNGPYLYHGLNAHRVRIMDSFTHYHPREGGFDEFYLVQMALPEARILTSSYVDLIVAPESVTAEQSKNLLQETPLQAGDLVYLPRGVAHRGLGGVLAQVITVPGFIPGSEIGLDHHLRAINERLALPAGRELPYNREASREAVVK